MQAMFNDNWFYRWNFYDLMPIRVFIFSLEAFSTTPGMLLDDAQSPHCMLLSGTSLDHALHDLVALLAFCYFSCSPTFFQTPVGQGLAATMSSLMSD